MNQTANPQPAPAQAPKQTPFLRALKILGAIAKPGGWRYPGLQ